MKEETNKISWVLFLGGLLLIFFRESGLFFTPRFWAEEGSIFFSRAVCNSFFETLWFADVGYYTLVNNLISEIATLVPLELAPLVTTISSFTIQLLVLYLIAFSPSSCWDSWGKKILISLSVILFSPPALWLNTTNIHAWLGLVTLLIGLMRFERISKRQKIAFRFLNSIAILSGPEALFFIPIYLWRYFKEKSKELKIQLYFLIFPGLIQSGVILYSLLFNNEYERGVLFSLTKFLHFVFLNGFGMLFPYDNYIVQWVLSFIVGVAVIFVFWQNKRKDPFNYLILVFFISLIISAFGSLGMEAAPRYSYLPTIILVIFFTQYIFESDYRIGYAKWPVIFILILSLSFSFLYFRKTLNVFMAGADTISWRSEVKKWRKDNTYSPRVLPLMGEFRVKMNCESKLDE